MIREILQKLQEEQKEEKLVKKGKKFYYEGKDLEEILDEQLDDKVNYKYIKEDSWDFYGVYYDKKNDKFYSCVNVEKDGDPRYGSGWFGYILEFEIKNGKITNVGKNFTTSDRLENSKKFNDFIEENKNIIRVY